MKNYNDNSFTFGFMNTTEVFQTLGCAGCQITRGNGNVSTFAPYLYVVCKKINWMGLENLCWMKDKQFLQGNS
jgi:hypothetical protein